METNNSKAIPQAEYEIAQDNDLFNAVRSGNSAIQPVLEDWMEIYQRSSSEGEEDGKAEAIVQMINFFLRCCGCNSSIDPETVLDLDAVTDNLDKIQEEFKAVPSQTYPLIVKSGKSVSKNFRKNLISLINQLVSLAHSNSVLYDQIFLNSLQSYLVSMSSSTLRSFRHTSTVIILFGFVNAICQALVSSRKELLTLARKVQSESSKSVSSSNKRGRLAEWKSRKKQVQDETTSLENFITDFVDGVFVHRYRDADPSVRADCIQALGQWMTLLPDDFLDGNYLRYIGWVLTDNNKDVRHEALKALNTQYSKEENLGAMQQFTTRFKSRLIEMATGESDLTTRSVSINIVTHIDRHGLLDPHQRNQIGRLIYHEDHRVRKAVSAFFNNLFEEALDSRRIRLDAANHDNQENQNSGDEEFEKQIAFKCLAHLLLKLERDPKSDRKSGEVGEDESRHSDDEPTERNSSYGESNPDDQLIGGKDLNRIGHSSLIYHNEEFLENGRVDFAIEDLWNQVEILHDWKSLCEYLLLDHTASINQPQPEKSVPGAPRSTRSSVAEDEHGSPVPKKIRTTSVDEACKLSESEETMLIEVLVASLRKFGSSPTAAESLKIKKKKKKKRKEGEEVEDEEAGMTTEDEANRRVEQMAGDVELENKTELTRLMIQFLPKLWSKFSSDPLRLTEVFRIPKLMSLNMYLDLRMVSAFEALWDTMIKHYLKQQHMGAIQVISSTIAHVFRESKSLQHINQTKIDKLHQALITSFKDLINEKPKQLEQVPLEQVEIISLTLLLNKISHLFRQLDLSAIFKLHRQAPSQSVSVNDDSSPYHLVNAIAHRGRSAHSDEAKLVEVALEILQLNFTWTGASVCHSSISESLAANNPSTRTSNAQPPAPVDQEDHRNPPSSELKEQISYAFNIRDNLINLCFEYIQASNATVDESVKRAAFIHLLNTYLLCQGALIPEDLRIECDEETQTRCASFVETQILKFIIDSHTHTDQAHNRGGNDDRSDADSDATQVQGNSRPAKGKKTKTIQSEGLQSKSTMLSLEELQRMEVFNLLITTFAKSIRCGLIHFQHSVVIIQHFTRFSKIFDISVELLIATLNDSLANYPEQIGLVVKCLTDSFKSSFELYLHDGDAYTEEQFIRVCRLLQSVFIIRGARMTYKPRLDSTSCVNFHLDCIKWLIDKATEPEVDPESIDKLGTWFRGLALFSIGLDGRSGLKIKTELERLVTEREFSVPTSKSWDPYQQYLKRLITVMAKDPSIKRAAKLALQQQGIDEELAGEQAGDESNEQPRVKKNKGTARKPKAPRKSQVGRPRKSLKRKASDDPDDDYQSPAVVPSDRRITQPRPKRMARRESINGPSESSHHTSLAPSSSHRASLPPSSSLRGSLPPSSSHRPSSSVSVLIPIGPKRKISESQRRTPDQPGKRARVDAVVISKIQNLRGDGIRNSEDGKRKNGKKATSRSDPTITSASIDEGQEVEEGSVEEEDDDIEEDEEEVTPKKLTKNHLRNRGLGDRDLSRLSRQQSSPAESEISLAQIKRKSRLRH